MRNDGGFRLPPVVERVPLSGPFGLAEAGVTGCLGTGRLSTFSFFDRALHFSLTDLEQIGGFDLSQTRLFRPLLCSALG